MEELKLILNTIEGFSGTAITVLILYFAKQYLELFSLVGVVMFVIIKGFRLLDNAIFSNRIYEMCGFSTPLAKSERRRFISIVKEGLQESKK